MTRKRKITYIAVLCLVAVLLVLGALFDLTISDTVYQPENFVAKLFESAGIFPPFVIVSAMLLTLFFLVREDENKARLKKAACAALSAVPYVIYGFMASETFLTSTVWRIVTGLVTAAVLTPLTFLVVSKFPEEKRKKIFFFLVFASIVSVLSNIIVINVLKYIWGRPRYREMMAAGDFSIFSNWYHINGFSLHGHHSFPSGHTASACTLFVFCALPEVFPEMKEKENLIAFIAAFYTFTMAYARVVIGAHFLSDVTAGFFIGFLVYAVTRYLFFKRFSIAEPQAEEAADLSETEETASKTAEEAPLADETLETAKDAVPEEKSAKSAE